jgi:4-carboxymuconolactone decarboxylase
LPPAEQTISFSESGEKMPSTDFTPEQIRAREAAILDQPPRIAPLKPEEFTPEVRKITDDLQRAVGVEPDGNVPAFIATMLRHPRLHQAHTDLALVLMRGTLSDRDRELAVLRVGWLCQAPFEWAAHVRTTKRMKALTDEEIARVTIGSSAPEWEEHERAVLKAVEEMFGNAMISDQTWATLAKRWSEQQLLELPLLIGQYQGVAYIQNSLRNELMPGDVGLTAR